MTTGHPQPATCLAAAAEINCGQPPARKPGRCPSDAGQNGSSRHREVLGEAANAAARAQGAGMTWEQAM